METQAQGTRTLHTNGNGTAERTAPRQDTITCINPATYHVTGEVATTTGPELERAVELARQAQRGWRRLEPQERARYLREALERLLDHRQELLERLVEETGKARPDALAEMLSLFDTLAYYLNHGPELLAEQKVSLHLLRNKRVRVEHHPVGVVLNLAPWTMPLDLAISPAIPALLAGNAVIIKPSELTPQSAITAANIINDAGLPRGLLQVLPGHGELGEALCRKVDGVVFTGSSDVGRRVGRIAGERLIPCVLELGGKDAMIVLNDADLERAAHGAVWGAFFNGGQICLSIERAYVQEDVYDDFVQRVVMLTRQLRQGDPASSEIDLGAMTDPRRIPLIEAHIADALHKGARLVAGGQRVPDVEGHYFEPTVLIDVTDEMAIMREETFAPVLPIMKVRSPAEAIQRTNDLDYALGASVWSRNGEVAQEVARQLDCGGVCINDVLVHYLAVEAPFGGHRHSGRGRRKGVHELRAFTNPKTVLEDLIHLKREPFWYPYSPALETAFDKAIAMLYRKGITGKISDLFSRG